jgi:hypothetical protein
MAQLRPPRGRLPRLLMVLAVVSCLIGGTSATAGLRPDPKPVPPQPRPELPPPARVSPQPPPAQPPAPELAPPPPAVVPAPVPAPSRAARPADRPKELSTRGTRRGERLAAARERRNKLRRAVGSGTVAPVGFSDPQSNVGTIVLLAMVALAAVLLLAGFGAAPARAAKWSAAGRVLEKQADVLVVSGFTMLAASGAFLLLFLMLPGVA